VTNVILNGTKWNEESEILRFAQNDRNQRVTCYRDRDENRFTHPYQDRFGW